MYPEVPMCNAFAERFVREARETLNSCPYYFPEHVLTSVALFSKYIALYDSNI